MGSLLAVTTGGGTKKKSRGGFQKYVNMLEGIQKKKRDVTGERETRPKY